jgi:hypothetical protein
MTGEVNWELIYRKNLFSSLLRQAAGRETNVTRFEQNKATVSTVTGGLFLFSFKL